MTAQRPESASDAPWFCGVPYPSAEAAVAARSGMKHAPKGLRVKHCEVCQQYPLRARNNLHGRHRGRSLKLPAGPRDRVPVTTRHRDEGSDGKGRPVSGSLGVLGTGRPQDTKNGSEGRGDG